MGAERTRRQHVTLLVGAGLAAVIGIAYANSFHIGFVFDDTYGIEGNPAIRSLRSIPSFFTNVHQNPTDNTQADLRPIVMISYALNYAVSGLRPWSYHALNLLLHLINALLVFVIVRDLVWRTPARGDPDDSRIPAAAAALFFALAPLNTQPVVYLWARSALLSTTFYLAAFLAFVRRRWIAGTLFTALALLTKPIAVTLPAVLLVYDFFYRDRARLPTLAAYVRDWRRVAPPVALAAGVDVAYLAYRQAFIGGLAGQGMHERWVTPWIWFVSQWPALLEYVRLFLWPSALSADHDFPYTTSVLAPRAWMSLIVLLAWAGLALRAAKRYPQVAFATAWFFITLAPESSFAPLAEVINDHRPYIASSLGLAVLLAWAVSAAAARAGRQARAVFVGVSLGLCAVAVPVIAHRNWEWQDDLRLWESTVRASPNNGRAWMNAGLTYMRHGDLAAARRDFERARTLLPGYAYLHMNLSVLEAREGHLDAALREAQAAVQARPDLSQTHYYLGSALQKSGRTDEALAAYQHGVDINPSDSEIRAALSALQTAARGGEETAMGAGLYALHALNDPQAAVLRFRQILQRNPTHYGATYQLAVALDAAGQPAEAQSLWQSVLAMAQQYEDAPTAETARARLAQPAAADDGVAMRAGLEALYARHEPAAAAAAFRGVLAANAAHYGATYQLAVALDQAGKSAEALPLWRKVLEMAEGYHDAPTAERARTRLGAG